MTGRRYNYLFEDNTNSWVLNMGENNNQRLANSEYKGEFALFGLFGRVDYSFNDKYLFTGIIRRMVYLVSQNLIVMVCSHPLL